MAGACRLLFHARWHYGVNQLTKGNSLLYEVHLYHDKRRTKRGTLSKKKKQERSKTGYTDKGV